MIKPNTEYTVVKGSTLIEAGAKVRSPSTDKFESCRGKANPDAIQCTVPNGGALYFTPDYLKPA